MSESAKEAALYAVAHLADAGAILLRAVSRWVNAQAEREERNICDASH